MHEMKEKLEKANLLNIKIANLENRRGFGTRGNNQQLYLLTFTP